MMVCSGVLMGWYGADVTPWIFYENFIELMVTIDAVNGSNTACINTSFCGEGACSRWVAKRPQKKGCCAAQREQAPSPQGHRQAIKPR
ncbi:hypothetical protein C1X64_05730 [Pseudomonas sp. GW456-E7]|nr:hypothetical protein C1X64_05730 [Pseudomonas sp. GW456-E7]